VTSPTRVLIADGARMFRTGVRNLLLRETGFEVDEAARLEDLALLGRESDIALIDLYFPPAGAGAAIEWLKAQAQTKAIVWSFDPPREVVIDSIRSGADGYLHKEITRAGLVRSLRGIAMGEAALSRDLANGLIEAVQGWSDRERNLGRVSVLSEREHEVLTLISRGARNRQIADALAISPHTVKRHVQNILEKLDVPSREDAAQCYLEASGEDMPAVGTGL
jgi:DNA-binding NarL/FixJ family response regulator